jgi:alkaline phosphatase
MARGEEPLLARRPSSHNDERATEEDALLTGQRVDRRPGTASRWARYREIALFTWGLIATAAVIVLAVAYQHQTPPEPSKPETHGQRPSGKRNLIFMVSDGMGPTSLALTRGYRQYVDALEWNDTLVLDKHFIGNSRTRSSNSLVTDSAAGATAFSCGQKSYNGAISVTPDHSPCGSVMEAAKRAGYTTGLVVTTRITDATPACFASHVRTRAMEDQIADQLLGNGPLGRSVDLMLGGGRCHFLPNTIAGGCRADGRDLIQQADEHDWTYISSRKDFDALHLGSSVKLPLLGLFSPTDIPFEIDRRHVDAEYPSLEEMAKTALRALGDATKDSDQGFFLMIEGSRIDHAGHNNDPAAQVHEVLAYDKAMQAVLDFIEKDDTEGLMVATSDHETGGLATARRKFILVCSSS